MKKKVLLLFLCLLMIVSVIPIGTISANAAAKKTQQEAVAWLNAQQDATYDFDGAYGTQCTEFVKAYVNFVMTGNPWTNCGYAVDYNGRDVWKSSFWASNGWTVYENTIDFVPQPGDIFAAGLNSYGHTGVVISSDVNSAVIAEANGRDSIVDNGDPVWIRTITWKSASVDSPYGATHFIRPSFATTPANVPTTGITLNAKQLTMNVGESKTITATILPSNASNKNITWTSNNTDVATVSSTGVIKAVSTGGAIITATTVSGSYNARIEMIVTKNIDKPLASVTYDGHDYELYSEFLTWEQAKNFCEENGGHLATISSEGENNAIVQIIKNSSNQTTGYEGFFIGLSDAGRTQGDYKWVTDEKLSYTSWAEGEPSNAKNFAYHEVYQDYCLIRPNGEWDDVNNYQNCRQKVGFICEYDKTQTPATVSSIAVQSKPTKTTYTVGETFSSSGLSIKVNMSDGTSKTVTSGFTVSKPDMTTAGTKTVTVTYEGKTTTFNITVNKPVSPTSAKYKISGATATAGSTVDVYVSIENNPGIISLRNQIAYDTTALELTKVEDLKLLSGYTTPSPTVNTPYTLRWADSLATQNNTANGNIVKLTFKIKDDAQAGDYNISVSHIESRTATGEKVEFADCSSVITVMDYILGDIDGNGEVDDWDAIVLNRYLAGWTTEINLAAADMDGDGELTDWDAIALERRLAGWDV